jgi:hypothetical protein
MEGVGSSIIVAVDLQLSIKVFGTDGLRAAARVMFKTFDFRTDFFAHVSSVVARII